MTEALPAASKAISDETVHAKEEMKIRLTKESLQFTNN